MDEFQKWWDETYGQILTITNDPDADASCRIAKITALGAWKAGIAALEAERDALRAAVKEARKAALEEALIACNGEALEDPTGSADDIAYDLAVEDCRNAIRAIAAKEPNRE